MPSFFILLHFLHVDRHEFDRNYHQVLVLLLRLRQVCSHASLIQEDCSAFTHVDDVNLKPDLAKEVTRARRVVSSDFVDRMKAKFKQAALYRIEAENNVGFFSICIFGPDIHVSPR